MFIHMESLPIRYFDTNAHGDIMSMYTNDIDTLRQMISQSIPQFINSIITIVSVSCQYDFPEHSADSGNADYGGHYADRYQKGSRIKRYAISWSSRKTSVKSTAILKR